MIHRILKYTNILLMVLFMMPEGISFCDAQNTKVSTENQTIETDQSHIRVEPVPKEKIEDFRDDNAFNYMVVEHSGFDFWSLFWYWFNKILSMLFSSDGPAPYIRYLIMFLAVAFIIYKIAGGNFTGIFAFNKKVKGANGFDYFEEDIHQLDIDKKLNEAIRNKNFRSAIRYYYLILLKKLDTVELIHWETGKTNRDYQKELENKPILDDFIKLSGIYEYSWYGNFDVDEAQFTKWQSGFNDVLQNINEN